MTLPTLCPECRHDVALHRSSGCLWMLGAGCRCDLDLRPPEERPEPVGH